MKCQNCLSYIFLRRVTLLCGHHFHKKCIINKRECPVCNEYILKDLPLKIIKSTDATFIRDNINKTTKSDRKHLLKKAVEINNTLLIINLVKKISDIKSLIFALIKEEKIEALHRLLIYYKIKNHMKYTLLDNAISMGNKQIIDAVIHIVGSRVEYNYFFKYCKYPVTSRNTKMRTNRPAGKSIAGSFTHSMLTPGDLFYFE
jgi:hypothetical protein